MRGLRRFEITDGQGVLEVLGAIGIVGVFLGVAVPAYLGFQVRHADKAAQENLQAAVPAAQVYRMRHGSYAGLDTLDLSTIDPRVSNTLVVAKARRSAYCVTDTVSGRTWSM